MGLIWCSVKPALQVACSMQWCPIQYLQPWLLQFHVIQTTLQLLVTPVSEHEWLTANPWSLQSMLRCAALHHGEWCQGLRGHRVWQAARPAC